MASYETEKSIAMVHSYSRTYSSYEEEENRMITEGHEACWTVRDSEEYYSFCVFHNGRNCQEQQKLRLSVRNHKREMITKEILLNKLEPYETVLLKPADHIHNLRHFLEGKPGSASLDFNVEGAFTRMLVGWTNASADDLQGHY